MIENAESTKVKMLLILLRRNSKSTKIINSKPVLFLKVLVKNSKLNNYFFDNGRKCRIAQGKNVTKFTKKK